MNNLLWKDWIKIVRYLIWTCYIHGTYNIWSTTSSYLQTYILYKSLKKSFDFIKQILKTLFFQKTWIHNNWETCTVRKCPWISRHFKYYSESMETQLVLYALRTVTLWYLNYLDSWELLNNSKATVSRELNHSNITANEL